jgi:acyl carrier protein
MKEQILKILSDIRPEIDYTNDCDFIENGMLDSLDIIRLVTELDETFDISINGADILPDNFKGLNEIENVIKTNGGSLL